MTRLLPIVLLLASCGDSSSPAADMAVANDLANPCPMPADCPCFSNDDCPAVTTCHSEDEGLHVFCVYGPRGTGKAGAACKGEADCESSLCVDGKTGQFCSKICTGDPDCPAVLPRCLLIGFGVDKMICSPPA